MIKWLAGKLAGKHIEKAVHDQVAIKVEGIKAQLGYSHTMTSGEKYAGGLGGLDRGVTFNHRGLRQSARRACFDNVQAKSIVDRMGDTVADVGLMLEPAPKADILGITQEEAEKWASNVEERFDSFARSKKQNRSEAMSFYQSHRLYAIQQQRDNDMFIRLYYEGDRDLLSTVQFEFIDADQIRGDINTSTSGPQASHDGIDRDERGRETEFKIWFINTKGEGEFADIPAHGPDSGRALMLHGFTPEYAGQKRGYSRIAHALQEFANLSNFSMSHIEKAISQATLAVQNTNKQQNPSNPVEDILTDKSAGPWVNDSNQPTPSESAEDPRISFLELPEATFLSAKSKGVFNLAQGDEIKAIDQTAPVSTYDSFVSAFTSYLAASVGIPIEVMLMKFNANYSASRASLILFWRIANIWRDEMASDYLNPVYEMWMSEEIAAGRIAAPGWSDPRLRAAWLNARWIGSPMPNIDPARTMVADKGYVDMGAQTLDRVARNLNGSSGRANRNKLSREFQELPDSPFNKISKVKANG